MEFKEPLEPAVQPPYPFHTVNLAPQWNVDPVVKILHPGYPSRYKPLIEFLALDNGGIDYDFAYYGCCILIENAWTRPEADRPYFSLTSNPQGAADRVVRRDDGILPLNVYYFIDPTFLGVDEPYPITPSFAHWAFPHDNLPPPWHNLDIAPVPSHKILSLRSRNREAILARDECCRVTQAVTGVDKAHVIPKAEAVWFTDNNMDRYVWATNASKKIHDVNNLFLLRCDVHRTFDSKEITIFPKLRDGQRVLVLHVLHGLPETTYETKALYHNRLLHQLYGVSPEYLFARFAWSVLASNTIQLLETDSPDMLAIRIREDAKGSKSSTSRVINVASTSDIPSTTSTESSSKKRPLPDDKGPSNDTPTGDDLGSDDSDSDSDFSDSDRDTQWDSCIGKRRDPDSDDEGSVDSEFEDFSHRPVKRGRPSARAATSPLPTSMTGSLATLPCSSRSNSSAETKADAVVDPKVSGFNPESGEIVPLKPLP
ncbi:hypothetical protein F5Y13DRAFT_176309 [Hypoxylon sp. FL1857]|nr:hypothetical protein F5Y13DRAFT_176309 [Hypoxylon sp. FL1857]